MKAAIYYGPGQMRLEQMPDPQIKEDELLVRVRACAVCGTDVKTFLRGHPMFIPPVVLGHEFAGEVAATGSQVKAARVGDLVTVAPFVNCGGCHLCQHGDYTLCHNKLYTSNGAFAEYVTVSEALAQKGLVVLPPGADLARASLTEPLACAINGVEKTGVRLGDSVLIIGAGPMGLLNLLVAQLSGACPAIVSDPLAERRAVAERLGAIVIDPSTEDVAARVKELTGGRGADRVIVAIGNEQAGASALKLVRPGGTVNFFGGFPKGVTAELDPNRIHYDEIRVVGAFGQSPRQFHAAANLLASGRVDVDPLITHRYPFAEILTAMDQAAKQVGLKHVIDYSD